MIRKRHHHNDYPFHAFALPTPSLDVDDGKICEHDAAEALGWDDDHLRHVIADKRADE
jgi:hypothetical protein